MPGNGNRIGRREVVKMLGSTAAAGVGFAATSGTAVATETERRLVRAYSDERRLRSAFQQHGEGLRQTLVDEGVVPGEFDFGSLAFDVDANVNGLEPSARDGLAGVTAFERDGVYTAMGVVSASTDTHDLALFVQPERDDAYALVEPKEGDERLLATESDVGPTGDCAYTECTSSCCGDGEVYAHDYECDLDSTGDCTNCRITNEYCGCSDCRCSDPACS